MKHLKGFNESNENIGNSKILNFYNDYKSLITNNKNSLKYLQLDESEILDEIIDLLILHDMNKTEVGTILKSFDCTFDNVLKSLYDGEVSFYKLKN